MNKKKWIIIGIVILALITSLAIAIPVFAADSNATPSPTQLTPGKQSGRTASLAVSAGSD